MMLLDIISACSAEKVCGLFDTAMERYIVSLGFTLPASGWVYRVCPVYQIAYLHEHVPVSAVYEFYGIAVAHALYHKGIIGYQQVIMTAAHYCSLSAPQIKYRGLTTYRICCLPSVY